MDKSEIILELEASELLPECNKLAIIELKSVLLFVAFAMTFAGSGLSVLIIILISYING